MYMEMVANSENKNLDEWPIIDTKYEYIACGKCSEQLDVFDWPFTINNLRHAIWMHVNKCTNSR